ncbi:MAG: crosslink repair DNA glycosylase YcaQ family protein [Armatimonadota bacterium]|nr:crosslink repair DNA glycosylase YcaQ family protein [Armatimonadota bacterium]MDR7401620.1 crosslink repair DNA glycosylase YcaQ family protein [Armatimonadota bacterium]MDR7404308.1 crosslink repair DNA glycosylase YcaQ family protein [Armatimonadota bacterium]MDR7436885.1 crosslink repair DNA glycosylase YcaQ family protein [Armatimonadota bacterium]MDR7471574.1 crosslink repair DNA glycosylase YcaQ family protein [Armatimonadota bacterium]
MPGRVVVTAAQIRRYRAALRARYRVGDRRAALAFVNAVGFCYAFTAGPGGLPGLFDVLATRSVDRMWEWAWRWKDELATARRLYYGRVLRRKPTYISLEYLPHFYALSGNVGEPDDCLQAYREGRLSRLAADVYAYLAERGPCDTWTLRRQFVGRGPGGALHRALADLQAQFLISKVDERADGSYSFVWDIFSRWLPQVPEAASRIAAADAAAAVLRRYLQTVGAAPPAEVRALFGWSPRLLDDALARGEIAGEAEVDGQPALAHPALLRWAARRRSR